MQQDVRAVTKSLMIKLNIIYFKRLDVILDSSYSLEALRDLHRQDLDSTWFGMSRSAKSYCMNEYEAQ